jgi:DNA-binding transcriptional ArsR family regulator
MASRLKHREATHNRLLAVSHPLRAAILRVLSERTASVSEVARELELERGDVPNVSHHVKQLVKLDCAEEVGERRVGRQMVTLYKATERFLVGTEEWEGLVEGNPELAEHLLGEFMQAQLDDYTTAVKAGTLGPNDNFHITRTPRILDAEGFVEAMELYEQCRNGMDAIERRAAERRSEAGDDAIHVSACLSLFEMPPPA